MIFDRFLRRVCAAFVLLFGFWTILANLAVKLNLGFADLRFLSLLVPIIAAGAVAATHHFRRTDQPLEAGMEDEFAARRSNFGWLMVAVLICLVYALSREYVVFWTLASLYLAVGYVVNLKGQDLRICPARSKRMDIFLFCMAAALAAVATSVIHRPDADDSLYLNMAVSVLDAPSQPMLSTDTLHAIPGGFYLPTYRVHSIELLTALIADIAGLEPIRVAHMILPVVFAFLTTVAAARFFRILLRNHWAWATVALVIILLVACQTHRMFGNFAYIRLFQGKAVFVTLMIPMIFTYAAEFLVRPGFANWSLLALTQIGAVGFTANALYGAPVAAALALFGGWRPSRVATRRVGLGLLASIYPLLVGLWVKQEMILKELRTDMVGPAFLPMEDALEQVLGVGVTQLVWLVALIGGWCLLGDPARRRWILGATAVFLLVFMNPYLDGFWSANLTGVHLIWRLFWVLPLPGLLTVLFTTAMSVSSPKGIAGPLVFFAVLLVFSALVLCPLYSDQPYAETVLKRPGLRVPEAEYSTAEALVRLTGPDEMVLAPEEVSTWVPTFRGHPKPVVSREIYVTGQIRVFSKWVDRQKVLDRVKLLHYVSGIRRASESAVLLARSLRTMPINAVAVSPHLEWFTELATTLEEHGFVSRHYLNYVIFYRGQEWPADVVPLLEQGPAVLEHTR